MRGYDRFYILQLNFCGSVVCGLRFLFIVCWSVVEQLFCVSFGKVMWGFSVLLFGRRILTVNICDSNVSHGNENAKALDEYIQKLENQKVEGRT